MGAHWQHVGSTGSVLLVGAKQLQVQVQVADSSADSENSGSELYDRRELVLPLAVPLPP